MSTIRLAFDPLRRPASWRLVVSASVLVGLLAACGAVDDSTPALGVAGPTNDAVTTTPNARDGGTAATGSSGGSGTAPRPEACEREFAAVSTAGLTSCGEGKGHCYDKDKTPSLVTLSECNASQWCVPDAVLAAGGNPLAACTAVTGTPGACASPLIGEVKVYAAQLTPDTCQNGDLCVPCNYPTESDPTVACKPIGVYPAACPEGSTELDASAPPPLPDAAGPIDLPNCCEHDLTPYGGVLYSGGECVPNAALTPQQQAVGLPQDSCAAGQTCAPNRLIQGQTFAPCTWEACVGPFCDEGGGVCIDSCFLNGDQRAELSDSLDSWYGCQMTEFCVPCDEAPVGTPGCY